jgi:heterodisulfide reductase subunit B
VKVPEKPIRLGYYPGCSLGATAVEFGESTVELAEALGIDLVEIQDWNCCGASSGHTTDPDLGVALPARVIALAAEQGFEEIAVPCVGCYKMLRIARKTLEEDPSRKGRIEALLGKKLPGESKISHILEVLTKPRVLEKIRAGVKHPPAGRRFACYYGCVGFPPDVMGIPDHENPQWMDQIVRTAGGVTVDWPGKVECCGGNLSLTRAEIVVELVDRLARWARAAGADAFVSACPLCQANLEMRQSGKEPALPSWYVTELVGAAMGLKGAPTWTARHLVSVGALPGAEKSG